MNLAAFNWVDGTILGLMLFSILISFMRGFVREAISLVSWVAAFWVAYKYGPAFATNFLTMIEMGQMRSLIAGAILFFAVLVVGAFINYSVSSIVNIPGLSVIDRTLGMAFGFARGILLIAVLILLGEMAQMDKKPWWPNSQIIPEFSSLTEWLKSFVPEQFEKLKPVKPLEKEKNQPTVPAGQVSSPASDAKVGNANTTTTTSTTTTVPAPTNPLLPSTETEPSAVDQVNSTTESTGNRAYY